MAAVQKLMMMLTVTSVALMIMMSLVLMTSRPATLTSDACAFACQRKCDAMVMMFDQTKRHEFFPFETIRRSMAGALQEEKRYGLAVQQSCNNNDECDPNTMECVDKEDGFGRKCYYTVGNTCPTGNTDDCSTNMICITRQDDNVFKCRYTAGSSGCSVIDIFCEEGALCEADICRSTPVHRGGGVLHRQWLRADKTTGAPSKIIPNVAKVAGVDWRQAENAEPSDTDCSGVVYKNMPSGVRTVYLTDQSFQVYCDNATDGGGWTVFQRRVSGFVDFHRSYDEYQRGFGDPEENFWLGLDAIHTLTSQRTYELRVDLWNWDDSFGYATFSNFTIADSSDNYRLHFDNFTGGNAGDSLSYHKNQQFSTHDADHDSVPFSCAQRFRGGWWFNNCKHSNLNGDYKPSHTASDLDGVSWKTFGRSINSFRYTEMKIRPVN